MSRSCANCAKELRTTDPATFYCGRACQVAYYDRLTRSIPGRRSSAPPQRAHPGVAALLVDRAAAAEAAENRRPVGQAETALARQRSAEDTARLYAAEEATMIAKLALNRRRA